MESKKNLSECKTAEELVVLAKENGRDITLEEAQLYLDGRVNGQEISDDELESVAGGSGCLEKPKKEIKCPYCGSTEYDEYGYSTRDCANWWAVCKKCNKKWS